MFVEDKMSKAVLFLENIMFDNEKNVHRILKIFFKDLTDIQPLSYLEYLIDNSTIIKEELVKYSTNNFEGFKGVIPEDSKEWSNKVYIKCYKTISGLESIKQAKDNQWKNTVATVELRDWIPQIHEIINRYDIEDDWEKIEKFLYQENTRVEWKSSFYISVEGDYISDDVDKSLSRQTLLSVTRAMLALLNTEGGTVLVGLNENPERISRKDIRKNILIKNGKAFFDVDYELFKLDRKFDELKQQIVDSLKDQTLLTAEKFNGLWSIEPIKITNDYRSITIYKINVARSPFLIFSSKNDGGSVALSLLKRADGRTIQVDPRKLIGEIPNIENKD